MHRVVVASIFEFVAYPTTHLETASWRHGYVAAIEQAVDITTKQEPVTRFMFTVIGIWANVGRVQCWKSPFARNGATASVNCQ
jgi:hypothetical protein